MSHAKHNAKRLKQAVLRVEQQPYQGASKPRAPRPAAGVATGYCQLGSSLGPATGIWPSITPTNRTGVSIYIGSNSTPTLLGTFTVYNYRNVTWAASKTTFLVLQGGVWHVIDQDC